MRNQRINDEDRRQWVLNDEGLYNMFRRSKHRTERAFVKNYRKEIDEVINNVVSGKKQAHYMMYG